VNSNTASLYEYVLQQMAAESYFEGVAPPDAISIKDRLILGTNREGYALGDLSLNEGLPGYTRMTDAQADGFLSKFSIIHQWSDDPNEARPTAEGRAEVNPGGDSGVRVPMTSKASGPTQTTDLAQ